MLQKKVEDSSKKKMLWDGVNTRTYFLGCLAFCYENFIITTLSYSVLKKSTCVNFICFYELFLFY